MQGIIKHHIKEDLQVNSLQWLTELAAVQKSRTAED